MSVPIDRKKLLDRIEHLEKIAWRNMNVDQLVDDIESGTLDVATEPLGGVKPTGQDNYCDELRGDWSQVPDWAIRRLNFLDEVLEFERRSRAPLMNEICPKYKGDEQEMSCICVKLCLNHLCDGSCGKCNEVWVNDEIIQMINTLPYEMVMRICRDALTEWGARDGFYGK